MTVFNKCDREGIPADVDLGDSDSLCISALTGQGIDPLLERIAAALPPDRRRVTLLLPFDKGALAGQCRREGAVESEEYVENGLRMTVTLGVKLLETVKEYVIE